MTRSLIFALLLAAFCALRCTETVLVDADGGALIDPNIPPRVLSTTPPMTSAGPYPEWDLNTYPFVYGIEVRFNKLMDRLSVRRGLRIESTRRRVDFDTLSSSWSGRDKFFFPLLGDPYHSRVRMFFAGETLSLSVVQPIVDVTGNVISAGPLGVFAPEPYFRVRYMDPEDGARAAPAIPERIILSLNSKIDSTILPFVTVTPATLGQWSVGQDSTTLIFPAALMHPSRSYTIAVAPGAPDREGRLTSASFKGRFKSGPFKFRGTSASYYVPLGLIQPFSLSFSYMVDPSTFAAAFHITPDVPGGLRFDHQGSEVWAIPNREYAPATEYAVSIDSTLRSTGGYPIGGHPQFSFRSGEFYPVYANPRSLEYGVPRKGSIYVSFPAFLDTSTVRRSFSIMPAAAGTLGYGVRSSYLTFNPSDSLLPYQAYVVTVDTVLRSAWGAAMPSQFTATFTTGGR